MAEGVYGAVEAKDCRIDKSKQLVTEGYVLADRLFQVFQLDIRIIQFCDQADGRQAAHWHTPSFHQLGTTEKISLEVVEVQRSALLKLLPGFDFLGDQLNRVLSDGLNGRLQCRPPSGYQVELHEIGDLHQCVVIRTDKVIERDPITQLAQVTQFLDQGRIGVNGLEDFQDHSLAWEALPIIAEDHIAVKIDESEMSAHHLIETDFHERVDDDFGRRLVTIGEQGDVLVTIAK